MKKYLSSYHNILLILLVWSIGVQAIIGCAPSTATTSKQIQETSPPCWRNELCRSSSYSEDEWYLGFAEDTLKYRANAAEFRSMLEQQARSKMVESIRMDVSSQTETETKSELQVNDGFSKETMSKIFAETIKVTASAEVINTFTDSYHDGKRIYAFAAVKKTDLAAYYAQMIELNLSEAMHGIELSKQLIELGKRNEAFIKLSEAKRAVESTAHHRTLLLTVDTKTGLEHSQSERANKLLKEIATIRAEATIVHAEIIEAKDIIVVFVTGTENLEQKKLDIIVPGLQTILYNNNIRMTENQEEANYILKIDAKACNLRTNKDFHYANACVKIILTNAKANINEVTLSITGPKEGGLSTENATEKAFRAAVSDVWDKVKDKILGDSEYDKF
ncbi:MAG: hypothetical protein LBU89_01340 [Fibromonadaceae bacterium]|jgi:hypothetical protein|nr:hypothetical protein [Fibromonadaceae bacterium]